MSSPPPTTLGFVASHEVSVGPGLVVVASAPGAASVAVVGDLVAASSSLTVGGTDMASAIAGVANSTGVGLTVPVDLSYHVTDSSVGPSRLSMVGLNKGGTGRDYGPANSGEVAETPGTGGTPGTTAPAPLVWDPSSGTLRVGSDFRPGGVALSQMF